MSGIELIQHIHFDRFTQLISDSKFWIPRIPSVQEQEAIDHKNGLSCFRASSLFSWEQDWMDILDYEKLKREQKEHQNQRKRLDRLGLSTRYLKIIPDSKEEAFKRASAARKKCNQRIEIFAFENLSEDLKKPEMRALLPDFPSPHELSHSGLLMKWLKTRAVAEQEKAGIEYENPIFVYWMSLHGLTPEVCLKLYTESMDFLREDSEVIEELGIAKDFVEETRLQIQSMRMQFSTRTQVFLCINDFLSALVEGLYAKGGSAVVNRIPEELESLSLPFRIKLNEMAAQISAQILASSISIPYQSECRREMRQMLSPRESHKPSPVHVARRRLSNPYQEEVLEACPQLYSANPLHLVLEYLNAAIRDYDKSSLDFDILSQKRELVERECRRVDLRESTLSKSIETLLMEDVLYRKRNFFDCRMPRTIRLIKACQQGAFEVLKHLPKDTLGGLKMSKIREGLAQPVMV